MQILYAHKCTLCFCGTKEINRASMQCQERLVCPLPNVGSRLKEPLIPMTMASHFPYRLLQWVLQNVYNQNTKPEIRKASYTRSVF